MKTMELRRIAEEIATGVLGTCGPKHFCMECDGVPTRIITMNDGEELEYCETHSPSRYEYIVSIEIIPKEVTK